MIDIFKYSPEQYLPAISALIEQSKQRIEAIANNPEPPTFANTIEAMEDADHELDMALSIMFNLNECDTTPALQEAVMQVLPLTSQYSDSVRMNPALFSRIHAVYAEREHLGLGSEQMQLLEDTHKSFARNGALLNDDDKQRLAEINQQLAELTEQFGQHVLADKNAFHLDVTDFAALSRLPQNALDEAANLARNNNVEGWRFTLDAPSYTPFMTYCSDAALREQMWRAYNSRGNRGNDNDNNITARTIANLRLAKANLLGHPTFCHYTLEERMVETPERLQQFMQQLRDAAIPLSDRDIAEVQSHFDFAMQPWDFAYCSEIVKQQNYQFDYELLRPYLALPNVLSGIFGLYNRLYGISFEQRTDIQLYNPEVLTYAVNDNGRTLGILYLDLHPRAGKRDGAWMTEFQGQRGLGNQRVLPLIQVVCNFTRPTASTPALLSFRELETLMHEMGHAMHGMLSDVQYASLGGTNVLRDFVELPSQLMENWCYEAEFLNTFATHYATGEPMPAEYIQKIRAGKNFLAGYACVRQINFGLIDLAFHYRTTDVDESCERLEHATVIPQLPLVDGCCSSTAFTHIFSGGYAAGYYSYKWAEVLDADVFEVFKTHGIFHQPTAARLRAELLSRGGTAHPALLFRNFMGRDPDIKAYMKRLTNH